MNKLYFTRVVGGRLEVFLHPALAHEGKTGERGGRHRERERRGQIHRHREGESVHRKIPNRLFLEITTVKVRAV